MPNYVNDPGAQLLALFAQRGVVTGGLTKQPIVPMMPLATLESWRAYRTPAGQIYLTGYCLERQEGRASTRVVRIAASERRCFTVSGREYQLVGGPGFNGDAEYVWSRYSAINSIGEVTDISDTLLDADFDEARK